VATSSRGHAERLNNSCVCLNLSATLAMSSVGGHGRLARGSTLPAGNTAWMVPVPQIPKGGQYNRVAKEARRWVVRCEERNNHDPFFFGIAHMREHHVVDECAWGGASSTKTP